jgi:DNA-binding response OmpR family regulator
MALGRVLVVDDQPQVMGILRDMLAHLGYEASSAASAEDAIAAMVDVQPHIVFLDLQLPGMSGLDALAYFRKHHPAVPVILVTGSLEQDPRHLRDHGAFDVIVKPFGLTTVKNVLSQAMSG